MQRDTDNELYRFHHFLSCFFVLDPDQRLTAQPQGCESFHSAVLVMGLLATHVNHTSGNQHQHQATVITFSKAFLPKYMYPIVLNVQTTKRLWVLTRSYILFLIVEEIQMLNKKPYSIAQKYAHLP